MCSTYIISDKLELNHYESIIHDYGWEGERKSVALSAMESVINEDEHPLLLIGSHIYGVASYDERDDYIYVHYFSSRFGGVGIGKDLLLRLYSKACLAEKRIVLHSSQEAEKFYEKYGMHRVTGNCYRIYPLEMMKVIASQYNFPL